MFDKGITVLFVSHSTEQVRRICSRAIILDNGSLIADGPVDEICKLYEEKYIDEIKKLKKKKKKKKKSIADTKSAQVNEPASDETGEDTVLGGEASGAAKEDI